jgi:hypothetical protein
VHFLIGLLLGIALLYFWLIGHWFARVLVFLLLAVLMALGGGSLLADTAKPPNPASGIFGAILGAALAWPVSGIPIYYWRWRIKVLTTPAR